MTFLTWRHVTESAYNVPQSHGAGTAPCFILIVNMLQPNVYRLFQALETFSKTIEAMFNTRETASGLLAEAVNVVLDVE